jgi:hypothetical protein
VIINIGLKGIIELLYAEDWEIAIGTGTTPEHWENLTLENEYDRADATKGVITTLVADDTLELSADFEMTEVVPISEFAVIHKLPSWMLMRKKITAVEVPAGYTLPVTIEIVATRE